MKTLNLDALSTVKRTITIGGQSYDVVEMTVENFIETSKAADRMSNRETSMQEQVEAAIAMIQRSIPGCPTQVLHTMTLDQLGLIGRFIRGEMDEKVKNDGESEEKKSQDHLQ